MVINTKIGYCPTMKKYVINFFKNKEFELINLGSARQVLFLLNNDKIDVGVIGRQAKKSEFKGVLKRIGTGYTLITTIKSMISNKDLEMLEIHTSISKEIIKEKYPYLKNVIYHNSLKDALSKGKIQLISWDDWNDGFELLIPVDDFNNKNPDFRVPHFYSKKDLFLEKLGVI